MSPAQHLLRLTRLYPDESLESYLYRLAEINAYRPFSSFLRVIKSRMKASSEAMTTARLHSLPALQVIATLSKTSVSELYSASIHRLAPVLIGSSAAQTSAALPDGKQAVLLDQQGITRHFRSAQDACYCPKCLDEARYFRVQWGLLASTVCPKHGCLLVDRCPKCSHKVSIEHILHGKCPKCGTLLDHATSDPVDDPVGLQAQKTLLAWMGFGSEEPLLPGLPQLPPSALYLLFYGLRASIAAKPRGRYFHQIGHAGKWISKGTLATKHSISMLDQHRLNVTAMKTLQNWPDDFFSFLDAYAGVSTQTRKDVGQGLGQLYWGWLEDRWKLPELQPVQDVYNRYLVDRQPILYRNIAKSTRIQQDQNLAASFRYITTARAAEILNTTVEVVERNMRSGRIGCLNPNNHDPNEGYYLLQQDVLELKRSWENGVSLEETALLLGASKRQVVGLAKAGLIQTVRGNTLDGHAVWRFSKASLDMLLGDLNAKLSLMSLMRPAGEMTAFFPVVQRLAGLGLHPADLLQQIISGELTAYRVDHAALQIRDIFLPINTAMEIRRSLAHKKGWITSREFAGQMGVKTKTAKAWIAAGLVQPVWTSGNVSYLAAQDIARFQQRYLKTKQAASLLGVGVLTVQKWARQGRLNPVSGGEANDCHDYLFDRSDLEKLQNGRRISAPELADKLGISRSRLWEKIKMGEVTPISGPGIDQAGKYLFLLDDER